MAKEALFNIINNSYYFNNISVLDLFSGTGNISFEFGSRGTENIRGTMGKSLDNLQVYCGMTFERKGDVFATVLE